MARLNVAINQDDDHLLELGIDFTNTGDNTIIAGATGLIIRIYKIFWVLGASSNITPKDGTTALTGAMNFSANEGAVFDFDTKPWFTLSSGNSFVMNQSGTAQVSGRVYYTQNSA